MAVSGFIDSVSTAVSVGSLAIDLLLNFFLVSESVYLLEMTLSVSIVSLGGACGLLTSKLGTGAEVGGFEMPLPALS